MRPFRHELGCAALLDVRDNKREQQYLHVYSWIHGLMLRVTSVCSGMHMVSRAPFTFTFTCSGAAVYVLHCEEQCGINAWGLALLLHRASRFSTIYMQVLTLDAAVTTPITQSTHYTRQGAARRRPYAAATVSSCRLLATTSFAEFRPPKSSPRVKRVIMSSAFFAWSMGTCSTLSPSFYITVKKCDLLNPAQHQPLC